MSADRSWTIAPTLLWFGAWLVAGLLVFDHDLDAIADRVTHRRDAAAGPAGPTFAAAPVEVAEASSVAEPTSVPAIGTGPDRSTGGALEDTCLEGTPTACRRWAMDGFYRAVAREAAGQLGRPVRVSWYGDSVIATDAIPARLRTRLQAELGDGGPGFVYVVPPHRFCAHEGVTRSHVGPWHTFAISTSLVGDHLFGAGGSAAETTEGTATLKLVAGTASRIGLHYLAQPHGGTATVRADGAEVLRVVTRADAKGGQVAEQTLTTGAKKVVVEVAGKVRVFGLALENASGAVVDNFGIVSVNAKSFANHDAAGYTHALAGRGADLLMVMIGANEAQWLGPNDTAMKEYGGHFARVLAPIRAARPDAACLVVSPTDQAEARDGAYPSRAVMPVLVAAQRQAARAAGCAFYSTYDWMGGQGSAERWFKRGYVGTDFQHLSRKGANKFSDAVFDALMAGYRRHAAH